MSTSVIPAQLSNMAVALPEEFRNAFADTFGGAMMSFNSPFNSLSIKGSRFRLKVGGTETVLERPNLDILFLGIAKENHNVYYKGKYVEGQDDVKPDAVWSANEPHPANVPASALVKNAEGYLGYATRRRAVFVVVDTAAGTIDFDNLIVFDVNAKSTFGDAIQASNAFGLGGYIQHLKGFGVYPAMLLTRIVFDTRESVPAVRFIPDYKDGKPNILPAPMLAKVVEVINKGDVAKLLDWNYGNNTDTAAPVATAESRLDAELEAKKKAQAELDALAAAKAKADADAKAEAERIAAAKAKAAEVAQSQTTSFDGFSGFDADTATTTEAAPTTTAPAPAAEASSMSDAIAQLVAGTNNFGQQ